MDMDLTELRDRIRFVADRPGHDRRYAIDTDRVRSEIGWQPRMEFDRGVKQTVDWYIDHAEWISHLTSGQYQQYYDSVYSRAWARSV
jgi:dTDP-glucose 4,6-dehydratase